MVHSNKSQLLGTLEEIRADIMALEQESAGTLTPQSRGLLPFELQVDQKVGTPSPQFGLPPERKVGHQREYETHTDSSAMA